MDSKTRVLTALARQKPDRPPFNFWMDRRLMAGYEQRHGHRHWRVTACGADVIETFHGLGFPSGPTVARDGTEWHTGPLFDDWAQADELPMPDPHDENVYGLMQADLREFPDTAVFLDVGTAWGIIAGMRTYERIYMDMLDHPDELRRLARRINDALKVVVDRACRIGVTAIYLMEDLATTRSLSFSPEMIREFCLDDAAELVAIAHSHNRPVLFHSDGCVRDLVPMLADMGVAAVNPLQPHLNDLSAFKRDFGHRLAVYGGLDNCYTIPDGTADDVRQHVRDVFETLGRPDGGLIFSTHDIPLGTSDENVQAMIETIRRCRY
ncbi:MAG: hypothetical protein GXY33_01925 [Phycisphaerae bacterium]|nr:hypothetical protein [Phycisphaerae bacterium]